MPELPDVEMFRKYLEATSLHQHIERAEALRQDMLLNVSAKDLRSSVEGRELESTRRHGKYLFVEVSSAGWLILHFGMTGFLKYLQAGEEEPPHTRLRITFKEGRRLAFDCQRA